MSKTRLRHDEKGRPVAPTAVAKYRENQRMKVGLFVTNQQPLDTDMVSALDDQFAMVAWRATAGGTRSCRASTT